MKKINEILLWIVALLTIAFIVMVELLILLAIEYTYMFPTNCKELLAYDKSRKERLVQLDEQVSLGIKDTIIVVPPLDAAYLHCIVDDISQKIIGNERYTKHALLKSGDVCSSMDDPYAIYNVAYRKVYNLPFDVVTNPDSKLNQYLAE